MINESALTHCPRCGAKLEPFIFIIGPVHENTYCPKCNIFKTHLMSMPFFCSQCYSETYYKFDNKNICWYCGSTEFISMRVDDFYEHIEDIKAEKGYELSTRQPSPNKLGDECAHENLTQSFHKDNVDKIHCDDCGLTVYAYIPQPMRG